MAASDKQLGGLHSQVAALMAEMLQPRKVEDLDSEGEVIRVRVVYPSAAEIAVAVKFLKDNSISADIEESDDLKEMRENLAKTRRPSKKDLDDAMSAVNKGLLN